MKTAIIFADGVKQIVFTPESDEEKYALSLITPSDNIDLLVFQGGMYSESLPKPFAANVSMCKGGWLRIFNDSDSRILVLSPKKELTQSK
jgi:hypothetical protein